MEFNVIDYGDKEKWEIITKDREVYYQWQYVDAFYKIGDGIPMLAYASCGEEYIINVFLLRDINKNLNLNRDSRQLYDITTPYGYGGVDYRGHNKELLDYYFEQFDGYCVKNNIVSEFVRLCPFTNNYKNYSSDYDLLNISKTVYIKLETPEQIWNDMESSCRNKIRKAMKNNLIVKSGFSVEMFDEFKRIYQDTMSRDNADEYYYFNEQFFDSIYENLGKFAKIFTVYLDDKPISSSIILYNGTSAHYHLSGTLSEYMKYGANNLGLYKIALELCDNGCKTFHLGGGYGGDSSPLLKFKKSFNKFGELDFYIAKKIYNKKAYEQLCGDKNVAVDSSFFPAYRKAPVKDIG